MEGQSGFRQRAMSGLQKALFRPTEYHRTKVGTVIVEREGKKVQVPQSTFPPETVWARGEQEALLSNIDKFQQSHEYQSLPLIGKLAQALHLADQQWPADRLNERHAFWDDWKRDSQKEQRYPAGSWAASPQQLAQLLAVFKVAGGEGKIHHLLRLGTASGVHTQQELLALDLVIPRERQRKEVLFDVVDVYRAPLVDTKERIPDDYVRTRRTSVLRLPKRKWLFPWNPVSFPTNSVDVTVGHYIESFIPTADEFRKKNLNHEQAVALKDTMLKEAYRVLKTGGIFSMALGTEEGKPAEAKDPRRFTGKEDLEQSLLRAGFRAENIIITPTTDPLDFENGKHLPGNYLVVAVK